MDDAIRTLPGEKEGDRRFFWVDESGLRCSPMHVKLSAALAFYENPDQRWITEDGKPKLVDYKKDAFPSQGKPVELRVGVWAVRGLTPHEQGQVAAAKSLREDGLV